MRIYLASSWRNVMQAEKVRLLQLAGHQVYDFKNPTHGTSGFHWGEIDPEWQSWPARDYRSCLLSSEKAARGFMADYRAMDWCDACVLLLPCGRSAHLELGWCAGRGKRTIIYLKDGEEPELMNLLADTLVINDQELLEALAM